MDSFPFLPTVLAALKRHRFVVALTFGSTVLGSLLYLLLTPPVYESSARIMLEEGEQTVSDLGRALSQLDKPGSGADPLATQSELITSEAVLNRAAQRLSTKSVGSQLTTDQLARVKVRVIPATNILELNFSHSDPEVAASALNAIVESTAQVNGEAIRQEASLVRQFLEEQLPRQETRLARAEAAEGKFRQENKIVSLDDQVRALVESLTTLEDEERQITAKLEEIQERAGLLEQVTGADAIEGAYDSVRIGQDQVLTDLRKQVADVEALIVEEGSRLGEEHPDFQALLEQREGLQRLYQSQISEIHGDGAGIPSEILAINPLSQDLMAKFISDQIEYQSLSKRLAVVQAERAALEARLSEIPVLSQPLASLTRQREAAEEALQNLRSNLEEARIAEAQLVSNIRILGEATVPGSPSEPSVPGVLVLGVAAGLLLSLGSLALLEALDNTIHDSDEAKAFLGLPVLGTLPPQSLEIFGPQDLNIFLDQSNLVAPYHSLMKGLQFHSHASFSSKFREDDDQVGMGQAYQATSSGKGLIILISSAFWGEGKSLVVSQLAAVAAMLGQKTLIIDTDLHYSFQSSFFKLDNSPGLTDVVKGDQTLLAACQDTGLENVAVLSAGRRTNRPSSVIESPKMYSLLEEAASNFDWVILDAPPVTTSSDLITLSRYCSGLFLVVQPGNQSKYELRQIVSDFQQSGGSISGLILNQSGASEHETVANGNLLQSAGLGTSVHKNIQTIRNL